MNILLMHQKKIYVFCAGKTKLFDIDEMKEEDDEKKKKRSHYLLAHPLDFSKWSQICNEGSKIK